MPSRSDREPPILDPSEYLETEEEIAAFLLAALHTNDYQVSVWAQDCINRARARKIKNYS